MTLIIGAVFGILAVLISYIGEKRVTGPHASEVKSYLRFGRIVGSVALALIVGLIIYDIATGRLVIPS